MKMTIGRKFGFIFIIITLLIAASTLANRRHGKRAETLAEFSGKKSATFTVKAKDMQIAVIQVQQWLTDISATRGAEGFDDGFREAQAQAALFKSLYKDFHEMFARENDKKAMERLEKLDKRFDAFYNMGKAMAAVYIADGPVGGNMIIEKFDPFAEAITHDIDALVRSQTRELDESMELARFK
ncbi:MAG: hypothetical protein GY859_38305 [Desulfobacterales bacterium]|nr:hypothetical protein [Desulfobacterales bacterium]